MKALLGKVGMFVVIAVIVVAAAGGAAYFAVRSAIAKPPEAQPKKEEKTQFVKIEEQEEFLTNLADPGGRRVIHLKIELVVLDAKSAEHLKEEKGAIRDQVLRILRGKTVADLNGEDGMDNLAHEIMNRLNVTVAEGKIRELYFTDIAVQ